ncbi:MAG: EF-P lysine aminoacylase GenX [Desulfobacter sp.]|nr:EF-P lysine aminoacylase GenX [Desulfobacter sp.]
MDSASRLKNLKQRSLVIHHTRDFFRSRGYLEVETPIMGPAIIPEAHIDPVRAENDFLQASPELCMKRLLSMGADKIFQICKCFRKKERGNRHLPELTMLEWYGKHQTYSDLMDQCQDLLHTLAVGLGRKNDLVFQGNTINLTPPFDRISVAQAFKTFANTSAEIALEQGKFEEILTEKIEPHLGNERPCFLYDYPSCLASLARLDPENKTIAQRFELYAAGIELANGFTELTDPHIQKARFKTENKIRAQYGLPHLPLPEKFLADLDTMPDAAGIALGMDRLVMLFCDAPAIDQVVAFTPEML